MKKLILISTLLAGAAFSADYILGAETQTGNGVNGMTRAAPTLATEGVPVVTNNISISTKPTATKAKVTIRASSTNLLANAADIAWMRCWNYGMDPRDSTGATQIWKRCPGLDMEVDGGTGVAFTNSLTFPPIDLGGVERAGNRYLWACSNCQQSGTLDAGVAVSVEMVAP